MTNTSESQTVIRKTDDMTHVRVTASDGSKLHNLIVDCDRFTVTIACTDSYHATRLLKLLDEASWIQVDQKVQS